MVQPLKRNKIRKFLDKWIELEKKIIPSEVTNLQKNKYVIFLCILAVNQPLGQ